MFKSQRRSATASMLVVLIVLILSMPVGATVPNGFSEDTFSITPSTFIEDFDTGADAAELKAHLRPTTIRVSQHLEGTGSGVIIHRDESNFYVLTCAHCVDGAGKIRVERFGPAGGKIETFHDPQRIAFNEGSDLAVLRVTCSHWVPVARLSPLQHLPSAPFSSVSYGCTAGNDPTIQHHWITPNVWLPTTQGALLRSSDKGGKGRSGGPVFNRNCEVVGLHCRGNGTQSWFTSLAEMHKVVSDCEALKINFSTANFTSSVLPAGLVLIALLKLAASSGLFAAIAKFRPRYETESRLRPSIWVLIQIPVVCVLAHVPIFSATAISVCLVATLLIGFVIDLICHGEGWKLPCFVFAGSILWIVLPSPSFRLTLLLASATLLPIASMTFFSANGGDHAKA